ncbi:hypothetical protein I4U23_029792 [Adineta vaga]|nr:hypothetical protein I4U23_029792 [Adineta vaga]
MIIGHIASRLVVQYYALKNNYQSKTTSDYPSWCTIFGATLNYIITDVFLIVGIENIRSNPSSSVSTFQLWYEKNTFQNEEKINIEKDSVIPEFTKHIQTLPKVIHHLLNKETTTHDKIRCCRRKIKIINQNAQICDQPLVLPIKLSHHHRHSDCDDTYINITKNYSSDQLTSQESSILDQKQYISNKNLGIFLHPIQENLNLIKYDIRPFYLNYNENSHHSSSPMKTTESERTHQNNEQHVRELVNTVRRDISALIDEDRNSLAAESRQPSSFNKSTDQYLLKTTSKNQNVNRSALKKKRKLRFALNMARMGINPSTLKDPAITSCQGIAIPLYNCENIGDQRFPSQPIFTTISENERNGQVNDYPRKDQMVVQSIDTQHGKIQIKLDPQSFGLAPFFSQQYETFIKGPPNSILFTNYIKTFHK